MGSTARIHHPKRAARLGDPATAGGSDLSHSFVVRTAAAFGREVSVPWVQPPATAGGLTCHIPL